MLTLPSARQSYATLKHPKVSAVQSHLFSETRKMFLNYLMQKEYLKLSRVETELQI